MPETGEAPLTLTRLRAVEAHVAAHRWNWAEREAETIERHWQVRRTAQPGLFDGTVLLCHACTISADTCRVAFFETRYANFLASRETDHPDTGISNAFCAVVAHTGDGAVLLGRMAAHTANAGQIYFPCGTPDRGDVAADGTVDLGASAAREWHEETGLALPPGGIADAPWILVHGQGQHAFLRPVRFTEPADVLVAAIEARRARQPDPELAGIVVARGLDDIDRARMPGFVQTYLGNVFAQR